MLEIQKKGFKRKWINGLLKIMPMSLNGVYLRRGNNFATDIRIGEGSRINGNFICKGHGKMSIGKHCAFGENISAIVANHNLDTLNLQVHLNNQLGIQAEDKTKKDIHIGNNVWIGDNVILLPGIKVGDGAIIGAGSIVTKDVEAYTINAGNPCRTLRNRFSSHTIKDLVSEIKWWDWTKERMKENRNYFDLNFSSISVEELKEVIANLK